MGAVTTLSRVDEVEVDDEALIDGFDAEQAARSCTMRTRRERKIVIRALIRRAGKPLLQMTRHDLIRDLGRPELSPKSRQNYRSLYHVLFTWMQDEGYRLDNPAARLPRGLAARVEANPFTTADVEKLLHSGIYGRTRMMVVLAAYQGFRATEIAAVNGDHIRWATSEILTVEAKGGHEVWRPLHPKVLELADAHPDRFPRSGWWFPGLGVNDGGHINAKSVSNVLSKAVKRAGIAHRPHQLRAWFATELVDSGADMLVVQQAIRHASPVTLRHYVKPNLLLMASAMGRLPDVAVPATSARAR